MEVRRLAPEEESVKLVGLYLLGTFAKEFSFGGLGTTNINGDAAFRFIWMNLLEGAVWVAEDENGLTGSLSVYRDTLWWSDTPYLKDGWLYVSPDKRKSGAAFAMMREAEQFAAESGLPLSITVMNSEDLPRKERFLSKMGYRPVGGLYLKDCAHG